MVKCSKKIRSGKNFNIITNYRFHPTGGTVPPADEFKTKFTTENTENTENKMADNIEKFMQHMPDCDKLMNHPPTAVGEISPAGGCTCGRDAAVMQVRAALTENLVIRQMLSAICGETSPFGGANMNLTVWHIGPIV